MNLPTIEPQSETESTLVHGYRVIAFILETNVTATLDDGDLDHAAYALLHVQASKVHKAHQYSYDVEGTISAIGLSRIVDVSRIITSVQKGRKNGSNGSQNGQSASKPYADGLSANPSAPDRLQPKPKTPNPVNSRDSYTKDVLKVVDFEF